MLLPGASVGICAIVIAITHFQYLDDCKRHQQDVNEIREENARRTRENELREKRRAPLYSRLRALEQEIDSIDDLIYRAYSANIVPGPSDRYRTMYCAVYLYEYFSKGRSNDMDVAINTYVLEQIKDRLDTIIRQNSDIMLNQELIYANQMRSMEDRRNYQNTMIQKINRLNCSAEEANQYRRAIDSRLETLEFFARDNYIRNLMS